MADDPGARRASKDDPTEDARPANDRPANDRTEDGAPPTAGPPRPERLWLLGRTAWALVGVALVVALLGYLASALALVVVPVILALFPATLLAPVSGWLRRRGLPPALAALVTVAGSVVAFLGILAGVTALVVAQIPELVESATAGLGELEGLLADDPLGLGIEGFADVLEMAQEQLGEVGDFATQAVGAAVVAFEVVAGLLLMTVVLFFYLKDGRRLRDALVNTAPRDRRPVVATSLDRAWETLSGYFRGQLLVAAVDAVAIGIGLLVLGVPLAVPLAVLVLFGGLFPIIGAVVTGALAVLVALADGGLMTGLIVAGIVLAVQQLEGNVLEPIILARAISLHPLVVLISITAGAVTLGVLGAFLAVPVAAIVARIVDVLRSEQSDQSEPSDQ